LAVQEAAEQTLNRQGQQERAGKVMLAETEVMLFLLAVAVAVLVALAQMQPLE